jgi:hypothetical protein
MTNASFHIISNSLFTSVCSSMRQITSGVWMDIIRQVVSGMTFQHCADLQVWTCHKFSVVYFLKFKVLDVKLYRSSQTLFTGDIITRRTVDLMWLTDLFILFFSPTLTDYALWSVPIQNYFWNYESYWQPVGLLGWESARCKAAMYVG